MRKVALGPNTACSSSTILASPLHGDTALSFIQPSASVRFNPNATFPQKLKQETEHRPEAHHPADDGGVLHVEAVVAQLALLAVVRDERDALAVRDAAHDPHRGGAPRIAPRLTCSDDLLRQVLKWRALNTTLNASSFPASVCLCQGLMKLVESSIWF